MNIERALRAMDSTSRNLVRMYVNKYLETGNRSYAGEALKILVNFDSDSDVREVIKALR